MYFSPSLQNYTYILKYIHKKAFCANCTNLTVFLSLPFSLPHNCFIYFCLFYLLISVLPPCSLLICLLLSLFSIFPFLCPLHWSGAHFFSSLLSFSLHQIFKLFLVCTSLTPMPHYRLMAPTVGFSPPLRVTLTFLTPTSAYITPLFSVWPVLDCRVSFCVIFLFLFQLIFVL